jgi:tRNA dimethylallyltransferase
MTLVVALVGPTATGKSDLGLALAHALDGEVVNADAMQLYRGMDIGTAKLSIEERQGVPHHLLDVLDVTQDASVADYQERARTAFPRAASIPDAAVGHLTDVGTGSVVVPRGRHVRVTALDPGADRRIRRTPGGRDGTPRQAPAQDFRPRAARPR